jgi:hypothetical protein
MNQITSAGDLFDWILGRQTRRFASYALHDIPVTTSDAVKSAFLELVTTHRMNAFTALTAIDVLVISIS